jgi:DNA-binding XRE family transcriptional regulator
VKPETLKALRANRRMSRFRFAKLVGVHRVTLGLYEDGKRPIPLTVALACSALAFNLPPME